MWGGRDRQGRGTGSAAHLWPAEERTLASLLLCAKPYLELKWRPVHGDTDGGGSRLHAEPTPGAREDPGPGTDGETEAL